MLHPISRTFSRTAARCGFLHVINEKGQVQLRTWLYRHTNQWGRPDVTNHYRHGGPLLDLAVVRAIRTSY